MRQIIQNLKSGETSLIDIPVPEVGEGEVLIKSRASLVSLGTERMLVSFGKANLVNKALKQPERVQQVLEKIKVDGLFSTLDTVYRKLDTPIPLGYSNAGQVIATGKGVKEFKVGDRVVSNGPHAEVVCVPKNLVAKIPDTVSDEEACFTVVGAIALHSIRLAEPTLGECFVVYGLGLVGMLTAELLKAHGCRVIGLELDETKLKIARAKGIAVANPNEVDPVQFVVGNNDENGADGVIITASAGTDEIVSKSAKMCRKRARIILTGVVGLDLNRDDFYEKELSFQVSCSYGPGRYDPEYEEKGRDYPLPYVRWTEKRNFRVVLQALSDKKLGVNSLISERVSLDQFKKVYDNLDQSSKLAYIISYDEQPELNKVVSINGTEKIEPGTGTLAVAGAGNFTQSVVMPALKKAKASVKYLVSKQGLSATQLAKKYGTPKTSTDYNQALQDESVDAVLITTRHNLHASMVIQALQAGKHVFVEKPLAMNRKELEDIISARQESGKTVTVGFNRRFSPFSRKMKKLIMADPKPVNTVVTVNAGFIPDDSWIQDGEIGGGRIIGEACHFIDLGVFLAGSPICSVGAQNKGRQANLLSDNVTMLLKHENGSQTTVNYFADGNKKYSKERVEVYFNEKILILDNFRKLNGYGFKNFSRLKKRQNKGHDHQFELLTNMLKEGGEPIIAFNEITNSTSATLAVLESISKGEFINIAAK